MNAFILRVFTLAVLLNLQCLTKLFAQYKDYIITLGDDTIKCNIENGVLGFDLNFKSEKMPNGGKMKLEKVYEYYTHPYSAVMGRNAFPTNFESHDYVRRIMPPDTESHFMVKKPILPDSTYDFFEWVFKGAINLYSKTEPSAVGGVAPGMGFSNGGVSMGIGVAREYISYFASKNDSTLVTIKLPGAWTKRTERKEAFYNLIADYPDLLERFKTENSFTATAIKNAITEYNNFPNKPFDYIVTAKNDTIKCNLVVLATYNNGNEKLGYKFTRAGQPITLNLDTVNGYSFKNKVYNRMKLPGDTISNLHQWLIKGKLNLFQAQSSAKDKRLFIANANGAPVEVISDAPGSKQARNDRTQAFYDMIADNPDLLKKMKGSSGDISSIVVQQAVVEYNKQAAKR